MAVLGGWAVSYERCSPVQVHICHALYYIHKKKNITHRDLTPNNILLATEQVCPPPPLLASRFAVQGYLAHLTLGIYSRTMPLALWWS